ncbi:MAG: type II secretion system protein [Desulfobacterales bacterium]|nr:type II secretion system protein [Desulfobacterales bacterium]
MRRHAGFTLLELMVVIGILGIMAVTAIPLYHAYQQRAYGSEAALMVKQIIDAQVMYFLERSKFFPEDGQSMSVYRDDPPSKPEILAIKSALNVLIPVGHFLDYHIQTFPGTADGSCTVVVSADFPLFQDGSKQIGATVDSTGKVISF